MKTIAEQMAIYEAYHKNPWNKATHFIGIPTIIFAVLIPLGWLAISKGPIPITAATALAAILLAYYFALDLRLALGMAGFLLPTLYLANLVSQMTVEIGFMVATAAFAGGWIFQFIGHIVFEKKRPAFTDNLFQLIIGPIFLVAEVYFLLGFRRELQTRVKTLATTSYRPPGA
jgi:uncharacterized membrane protein YGL010W